jgi:type I restriction enzyme R subunit
MNKKDLSERDICTKFISPAVKLAGWDEMTQVREEVGFTNGRILVLDDRTKLVAAKVSDFLRESGNRFQKTIVFCVDEEHAARMRQALINENKDLCDENHRYVMRITGSDTEGQAELGNFIDPEAKYPVLVTTSRLLSTGVDAQTCRLIVLDRAVGSMTEFKQIIGRGTRVHEDTKKFYFTLIDFRGATNHFADPDFDGEPVQIYEPGDDDPITPPDDVPPTGDSEEPIPPQPGDDEVIVDGALPDITIKPDGEKRRKIYVDGVAGGAHLASCAMCAGLGATIPGCLASSPVPMHNVTLPPAEMPHSL